MNITRNIIGSYLIIRGSPSFPSVRANILSVIGRVAFPVSCSTVSDFNLSKSLLPRVVALLFCLLLFTRIREVVPISSQRLLTVAENMVTMISDTCGYVLFLLLLLLVPYIESGECKYIYFRIVEVSLHVTIDFRLKRIIKIINQVSIDTISHARCISL